MNAPSSDMNVPGVAVRLYRPSDLEGLYALDCLCFAAPFRFSLRTMRRFATAANAITLVATSASDDIAGFLIMDRFQEAAESVGYVVTLDVRPVLTRRGIATLLMHKAEEAMASDRTGRMRLHVHTGNAAAIFFYERLHYIRRHSLPNFYGLGLAACMYEKLIPPQPCRKKATDQ